MHLSHQLPDICGSNFPLREYVPCDEEEDAHASYTADKDVSREEADKVAELEDAQQ